MASLIMDCKFDTMIQEVEIRGMEIRVVQGACLLVLCLLMNINKQMSLDDSIRY